MSFILKFDLNIFAVILLFSLLIVIYSKREIYTLKSRLFRLIIFATLSMLILEIFSWVYDSQPGDLSRFLHYLFNFTFIAFNTVVVSLWASYIDYLVYEDKKRLTKRLYYLYPTIILVVLSIINIFEPILFVIDSSNEYHRLPFMWVSLTMTSIIYIYVLAIVFKRRETLSNSLVFGVMLFLLIPMLSSLLQLFFYGLFLIWPSTAVALIFSYLIFETTSASTDFLTGAASRNRAEDYITNHINKRKKFSVIMIDIDDFKILNDTYGHHIGDKSLIEMSKILRKVFNEKAVVSRFGGDEFLIVTEVTSEGTIQFLKQEIFRHLRASENKHIRTMSFSYGVSCCLDPSKFTTEEIMIEADNNMYLDKAINKNLQRRKSDR